MSNSLAGNSSYDAFGEAFAKSREEMEWPEIDDFIKILSTEQSKLQNLPIRILEAGSGSGRFLSFLKRKMSGFEYVGFDSSSVLVNSARKKFPEAKFALADMRKASDSIEIAQNAPYHAVVAVASFHHLLSVQERSEALSEFRRLLVPGGRLLMTNWNLFSALNRSKYARYRDGDSEVFRIPFSGIPRAYFAFDESLLLNELSHNGFEILRFEKNERNLVVVAELSKP